MSEWQYQPECRCHYCTQIRSAGTLAGAAQGMNVDHDPAKSLLKPLPPSEKAELQVSLLNEIGLTLTAAARALAEQAETLKTYKLSLEGIQGLLVDLEHSFDVIAEVQANSYDAVVTKFMHIEKRLAQIEERLRVEMEGMRNIVDALGERLEPCKVCAGKRRVHALFERKTLENKAATVDEIMAAHDGRKPRKAGKRKRVKR